MLKIMTLMWLSSMLLLALAKHSLPTSDRNTSRHQDVRAGAGREVQDHSVFAAFDLVRGFAAEADVLIERLVESLGDHIDRIRTLSAHIKHALRITGRFRLA